MPAIPDTGQWANFIRNHDELSLDKLSDAEREEIAVKFAPDKENMWVYNRGIRRRLPPLLDGDLRRIKLAYSLMFTLPGTPVINYGEEIGMGDDLSLPERNSTRTPMQWSKEQNGGFSSVAPAALIRPAIRSGTYGYEQGVNVIDERRDPDSLLNWMERAIRTRRACIEFGWGKWSLIETGHQSVFAHRCEWQGRVVIAVHNLSQLACEVKLELQDAEKEHLIELLGDQPYEKLSSSVSSLQLEGYGYRWFRVGARHLF